MSNYIDLTGKVFNKLTVIKDLGLKKGKYSSAHYWLCKCECGNMTEVMTSRLKGNTTKSCGCWNIKNLSGKTFGELTVTNEYKREKYEEIKLGYYYKILWLCKCSCGVTKWIRAGSLLSGRTITCGSKTNHYCGEKNGRWKGGRVIRKSGYVDILMPGHPNANKKGYVQEHIYVMSQFLKRRIETEEGEMVHHKNDPKSNNLLSNLELWTTAHPPGHRVFEDLIPFYIEQLKLYKPEVLKET